MIDSLPWRDRWLLHAAHPGKTIRYWHHRFKALTTMPGDVWLDFLCQRVYVIRSVKAQHVEAEVWALQLWDRRDELRNDPRCVPSVERLPRADIKRLMPYA